MHVHMCRRGRLRQRPFGISGASGFVSRVGVSDLSRASDFSDFVTLGVAVGRALVPALVLVATALATCAIALATCALALAAALSAPSRGGLRLCLCFC